MDLSDKDQLISYLKVNGLWAKKGLGQNFLVDKIALENIVKAAEIEKDDLVIEVGPGTGVLTQELVQKAGEVVAVEMDKKLAGLLSSNAIKRLKVFNNDILKINLDDIIGSNRYKVVANIPYYITSKILELFLTRENRPETIVLLVQKEVAERICAKPGDMSILSLSVQLYGEPEVVGIVPANSFFPAPKVDSAILRVKNIKSPDLNILEKDLFRLIHIGFSSRRKTLANNLSAGYHINKQEASDIIKKTGFDENVRAQELSIPEWVKLAEALKNF